MTADLEKLLHYLEVEQQDDDNFAGNSPADPPRVFGGQALAQAFNAAGRTVDAERVAHSMHAYFLRPGDPAKTIIYEVERIRDGKSFTTRRVVARQAGVAIFSTSISFHVAEAGLSHQSDPPQAPPPEDLESDHAYWLKMAEKYPDKFSKPEFNPIERRPVQRRDLRNPQPQEPEQQVWVKTCGDLGDDLRRHQMLLAYISDFGLLGTALLPHAFSGRSNNLQWASLDHALWFHRPFRVDEYLLYALDSPSGEGGRGFSRGSFYTRDGILVASSAQESLLRVLDGAG